MKKRLFKRRFTIRVHPAGFMMLVCAFLFAPSEMTLAAVLALLWHEAAHVAAMALCGVKECSIELTPFGGMAEVRDYERLSAVKQALIAAAGVLASALGAYLCICYAPRVPFWYAFANFHFSLAIINCLPAWPLDGARVLMALGTRMGKARTIGKVMLWLSYLLGAMLSALGLYGVWRGHINLSLLLMGPYLCYAAHQSAVMLGIKRMQRAAVVADQKLLSGGILPIRALGCTAEPDGIALARLMERMSSTHFHLLYVFNKNSGRIENTLTEHEMARKLFT